MTKLSTWISVLIQKLWIAVALCLVIVAVLLSLTRLALPLTPQYKPQIESYLQQRYNIELSIGQVESIWHTSGPQFLFKNLDIELADETSVALQVNGISGQLNFWRSLINWTPIIDDIQLRGLNLVISDVADSNIASETAATRALLQHLLLTQLTNFSVFDSQVTIIGDGNIGDDNIGNSNIDNDNVGNKSPLIIEIKELLWGNWQQGHRGMGKLVLQGVSDNTLDVRLNVDDRSGDLSGTFYVDAENMDISEFLRPWLPESIARQDTQLSFQLWLNFSDNQVHSVQAKLSENQMRIYGADVVTINANSGLLRADRQQQDWHIQGSDLAISVDQGASQSTSFTALLSAEQAHRISIQQFTIDPSIVDAVAVFNQTELLTPLRALNASTKLSNIHGFVEQQKVGISARVTQITSTASGNIPAIPNVVGELMYWDNTGHLSLSANHDVLDVGLLLPQDIAFDHARLSLWFDTKQRFDLVVPELVIESPTLNINTALKYSSREQYLLLDGELGELSFATAKTLLPSDYVPPKTLGYLNRVLEDGVINNGRVIWSGVLGEFPFTQNQGIFQAQLNLEFDKFEFSRQWPALENTPLDLLFENRSLHFSSPAASISGLKLSQLQATIPVLGKQPEMRVTAKTQASSRALKAVLDNSPLKNSVAKVFDQLQVSQQLPLSLDLNIPLTGGQVIARGLVDFSGQGIYFPALNLDLAKVDGELSFVNDVINADQLTATVFKQPVSLRLSGEKNNKSQQYQLTADIVGAWNVDRVIKDYQPRLKDKLSGLLDWQGKLAMSFAPAQMNYDLQLSSRLEGVSSGFPAPFDKTKDQAELLFISAEGDNQASSISAIVNDNIKFNGLLPHHLKKFSRAHLRIGETELMGMGNGFSISVALASIDGALWVDELSTLLAPSQQSTGVKILDPPSRINISADSMQFYGYQLNQVDAKVQPTDSSWQARVSSKEFNGRLEFARDWLVDGITVDADFVKLQKSKPTESKVADVKVVPQPINFQRIVPIQLQCADCTLNNVDLGKVALQTRRESDRLVIDKLDIEQPYLTVGLTGEWSLADTGTHSRLKGTATSRDIGVMLEQLGINTGLRDAGSNIDFEFDWRGAPYAMDTASLAGKLTVELDDGYIKDFSDQGSRVSRILGLLSLNSLLRKLRFDFRDIFKKGFFFEDMQGSFGLDKGVASTEDFFLDGPGLDVSMQGYLDLNTDQIDFTAGVIPNLTSSFPVLLWMVNPTVGLAGLALDEAVKSAKVVSNIQYNITGTLNQPEVEEISRNTKPLALPQAKPEPSKIESVSPASELELKVDSL